MFSAPLASVSDDPHGLHESHPLPPATSPYGVPATDRYTGGESEHCRRLSSTTLYELRLPSQEASTVSSVHLNAMRRLPLRGASNLRDLGGYAVGQTSATRWGRVFRSDALHHLSDDDVVALDAAGVREIYDLRRNDECDRYPCRVRCVVVALPSRRILETNPADLQSHDDGERWLYEDYLSMLEHGAATFGRLFNALAEVRGGAALFHCHGGKDRTGIAAALLLSAVGVSREQVLDDYELTDACVSVTQLPHVVERFVSHGIARPAALALLGTPRWAMAAALEAVDDRYGGIEDYLLGPAEMTAPGLEFLRNELVG